MKCGKCGKDENPHWVMSPTSGPLCIDCAWNWQTEQYAANGAMLLFTGTQFPKLIELEPVLDALKQANEQ